MYVCSLRVDEKRVILWLFNCDEHISQLDLLVCVQRGGDVLSRAVRRGGGLLCTQSPTFSISAEITKKITWDVEYLGALFQKEEKKRVTFSHSVFTPPTLTMVVSLIHMTPSTELLTHSQTFDRRATPSQYSIHPYR